MPDQTTPTSPSPHGRPPRGIESVARSVSYEGRFGRIFRNIPPFTPNDADLIKLAKTMIENDVDVERDSGSPSNSARISAGFTYLGQFIDHDLTFDPTSKLQRDNDPDGLKDFRTPRFDLDSVYGKGPDDNPFLYQNGLKMLLGKDAQNQDDLPRNSMGRALLGDPRNDENLIVSQIHLAVLKFHNKVVDELQPQVSPQDLFDEARTAVRWHYQWIVLHDFLRHIVGEAVIKDILREDRFGVAVGSGLKHASIWKPDLKFFHWKVQPFMPVEFSVAAYRFGHSMVRRDYALNETTANGKEIPIFDPAHMGDENGNDLRGFRFRPNDRQIEWFRFFKFSGHEADLQPARAIDTLLVFGLGGLPFSIAPQGSPGSLAARNLLRGKALGLPSGQAVAEAMGIPKELIITADNVAHQFQIGPSYHLPGGQPDPSVPDVSADKAYLEQVFGQDTPLWYYILKEAELITKGETLGPVGGRIVAEVFIGLLTADPFSFLNVAPNWKPQKGKFGCPADGQFQMTDLLKHVA